MAKLDLDFELLDKEGSDTSALITEESAVGTNPILAFMRKQSKESKAQDAPLHHESKTNLAQNFDLLPFASENTLERAKTRRLSARKKEELKELGLEHDEKLETDDSMLDNSEEEEKNEWLKKDILKRAKTVHKKVDFAVSDKSGGDYVKRAMTVLKKGKTNVANNESSGNSYTEANLAEPTVSINT